MATAQREELRFELVGRRFVTLTIEPDDHRAERLTGTAQLLNLSSNGARLSVPFELPKSKSMRIKLEVDDLGLSIYMAAEVCWQALSDSQENTIGCRLSPQIPPSILKHVTEGSQPDRRDEERLPSIHRVVLDGGLGPTQMHAHAELRNYAAGGLCLEAAAPAELGQQLRLQVGSAATEVRVVVRWHLQKGVRHLIGCVYADPNGFERLTAALK
jgi:hypothetical protein